MRESLEDLAVRARRTTLAIQLAAKNPPRPKDLRAIRESLGLSLSQMAVAVGFEVKSGERRIRDWEVGNERPTGSALQAIRFLAAIDAARACAFSDDARAVLLQCLPEFMRHG